VLLAAEEHVEPPAGGQDVRCVEEDREVAAAAGRQEYRRLKRPLVRPQTVFAVLVQLGNDAVPEALIGVVVERRNGTDLETGPDLLGARRERKDRVGLPGSCDCLLRSALFG
jgi:hypothetical protein